MHLEGRTARHGARHPLAQVWTVAGRPNTAETLARIVLGTRVFAGVMNDLKMGSLCKIRVGSLNS